MAAKMATLPHPAWQQNTADCCAERGKERWRETEREGAQGLRLTASFELFFILYSLPKGGGKMGKRVEQEVRLGVFSSAFIIVICFSICLACCQADLYIPDFFMFFTWLFSASLVVCFIFSVFRGYYGFAFTLTVNFCFPLFLFLVYFSHANCDFIELRLL